MNYISTYLEAVDFLQNLTNLHSTSEERQQRSYSIYKKRMDILLDLLNNPQDNFKFIHVSGTNGKGSTVHMLHEMLYQAGKSVGSYTSPHVCTYAERIKVNNHVIPPKALIKITNNIKVILDKFYHENACSGLSFTEINLLIAFSYFAQIQCEYVIIEVGCGGKNDATNIIPPPEIAIITNVGLDHTKSIGPTLEDIAHEKSGIIKKNSYFLTQEQNPDIKKIFQQTCKKEHAIFGTYNQDYTIISENIDSTLLIYNNNQYFINLGGKHQIKNALLCIAAAEKLGISQTAIEKGLAEVQIPGRFEIMQKKPLVILDGAHNPDKIFSTIKHIKNTLPSKKIWVLYSSTNGEKIKKTLEPIAEYADEIICTRHQMTFRKTAPPYDLLETIKKVKPDYQPKYFLLAQEAFDYILKNADQQDVIIVTGSLYMIGLIRERWISEKFILKKNRLFK